MKKILILTLVLAQIIAMTAFATSTDMVEIKDNATSTDMVEIKDNAIVIKPIAISPQMELALISGNVTEVNDNKVTVKDHAGNQTIILSITDDTIVMNAMTGEKTTIEARVGDAVSAYYGPAVMHSLPAQSNATIIMTSIAQDAGFPMYSTIKEVSTKDGMTKILAGDKEITANKDTMITDFTTNKEITVDMLTVGSDIVTWIPVIMAPEEVNTDKTLATKIVLVEGADKEVSPDAGDKDEVSVYVELRATAEKMGYTVTWDSATQGITIIKGKDEVKMQIGNTEYMINGKVTVLVADKTAAGDVMIKAPYKVKGVTMVSEKLFDIIVEAIA